MSDDKEAKTLANLRVLVTRSTHQSGGFTKRLQALGAQVIEIPMLHIAPPESFEPLDTAIRMLPQYRWVVFASANAAHAFFDRLRALGFSQLPDSVSIAAIGPGTAKSVEHWGHQARYQPREFIAESFISNFPGFPNLEGTTVLWPKGDTGRWVIRDKLQNAGALVTPVVTYRSTMPPDTGLLAVQLANAVRQRQVDVVTMASGQTAKNFITMSHINLNPDEVRDLLRQMTVVTIGPETSAAVKELGFTDVRQAGEYTTEGMVAVLESMAATKRLKVGHYKAD
jgi:uroporphyrinogen III methyltransferase/synthase